MSDSLGPRGLYSTQNSPGQNTGVGSLSILQGIFPTQGMEPRSPALQADSLLAESQGTPKSTGVGSLSLLQYSCASLVAQLVKNPPAMQETWVRSLGWEDLLEKREATHSSILPGKFQELCSP